MNIDKHSIRASQHAIKHTDSEGNPQFTNRLIFETSPYLLQHAHNPVDWFPWCDEAFEKAKQENRPVLLSIGYSTCHWCHVMEEESFEDLEIAHYINQHYIPIKVDREERPDIDNVYMNVVQMLTGRGGWPMTVWLTPHREPFYAGTYFPARDGDRGVAMGFFSILQRLLYVYREQPADIERQARIVTQDLRKNLSTLKGKKPPKVESIEKLINELERNYDSIHGGFGYAPKFPRPVALEFLLQFGVTRNHQASKEMFLHTLKKMALGGIYDQVGGGFCRYSTDASWLVPHFEKMLYDNAQLAPLYVQAFQWTGETFYRDIATDILEYLVREMKSPNGGFYSASDADSEGEEGKFFLWNESEVDEACDPKTAEWIKKYYGIEGSPNFEGKFIPNCKLDPLDFCKQHSLDPKAFSQNLEVARASLYQYRKKRIAPDVDTKVLTSWNAMVIEAFSKVGFALKSDSYMHCARETARFILQDRWDGKVLYRMRKNSGASIPGFLDDYAYLVSALIELYQSTGEGEWLTHAIQIQERQIQDFWDEENGAFYMSGKQGEKLIAIEKPFYDGAEPSGNSISAFNLFRLYHYFHKDDDRRRGEEILASFSVALEDSPSMVPMLMKVLDFARSEVKQVAIFLERGLLEDKMMEVVRSNLFINKVLAFKISQSASDFSLPLFESRTMLNGKTTAYVCVGNTCHRPTLDPAELKEQISQGEAFKVG